MTGTISKTGYYSDCLPYLVIKVKKQEAQQLRFQPGVRVPVHLSVNGITYKAGLRATEKMDYLKICGDLEISSGEQVRLTDVLLGHGLSVNQKIRLQLQEDCLVLLTP